MVVIPGPTVDLSAGLYGALILLRDPDAPHSQQRRDPGHGESSQVSQLKRYLFLLGSHTFSMREGTDPRARGPGAGRPIARSYM